MVKYIQIKEITKLGHNSRLMQGLTGTKIRRKHQNYTKEMPRSLPRARFHSTKEATKKFYKVARKLSYGHARAPMQCNF